MSKRKLDTPQDTPDDISPSFIQECREEFNSDPTNIAVRNAVASVGSMLATTDSSRVNQISHIFLNTVKKKNVRATNQGASGRCWIFSALNTFRHMLINALNLENFEFSQTYLFFWDKLERSNTYLRWFIDHPNAKPGDRDFTFFISDYNTSDGGWWNMLASLVKKYGLVPASAMRETYQSDDSEDMNHIIKEHLDDCVIRILQNRDTYTTEELDDLRITTVKKIYDILVKFLGEPPSSFNWSFSRDEEEGGDGYLTKLTPHKFLEMVMPDTDMTSDFVVLSHVPAPNMIPYQNYSIKYTRNVYEGQDCTFFHLPIEELKKYAMASISAGMAVWVVADVRQCFNWFHSTLDDKLDQHNLAFGETSFDKGQLIQTRSIQGTHAMALTGYNLDEKGRAISWQTENSWGYYDNETPGLDGFLYMSDSWFTKYVIQIAVHKDFLSRTLRKKIEVAPIELEPWDAMAPALKAGGYGGVPKNYGSCLGLRQGSR